MTYDNQGTPPGVLYIPTSADWATNSQGQWFIDVADYLSLDSGISIADQILVVRQADFSTISPVIQSVDTWNAWTCPNINSSGSTMYTLDGSIVIMSSTAADYTFQRGGSDVVLPLFDPTTDTVYILRKTQDLTNYVSWVSGSHITAAQLNRAFTQLLNIAQENAILADNKSTLDPNIGNPSGICPLDSTGKIASTYIGASLLASETGDGIDGTGSVASPLVVDLDPDSGMEFSSGKLKVSTVDSVVSTDTSKPLSANQGKLLQDKIDSIGAGITFKGAGDMVTNATFYDSIYGTPAIGDTVVNTNSGSGTAHAASWGALGTITQYDTIRYTGTAWIIVDVNSYIKTDGTTALHTDQKSVTQAANEGTKSDGEEKSIATVEYVEDAISNTKLSELTDVNINVDDDTSDPAGQMLFWDADEWAKVELNKTDALGTDKILSTGDGLGALDDVTPSLSASNGDFLKFNGSLWIASSETATAMAVVPADAAEADGTSVDSTAASGAGGSDDSTEISAVLLNANLGHNNNPDASTVSIADFNGAVYKCSHVQYTPTAVAELIEDADYGNSSPNSMHKTVDIGIPNKRDIVIRNGTLTTDYAHGTGTWSFIDSWFDSIDSADRVTPTTTLTTATKPGIKEITVGNVMNFPEGCLIHINIQNQTADDVHDVTDTGKMSRAETNKVEKVEEGKLYLKYPTLYSYRSGATVSTYNTSDSTSPSGFDSTTGASATIVVPSNTETANDDTIAKILIITTADKKKWYLQSTNLTNDFSKDGTLADPILYAHSDLGSTLLANIATCINGHTELTKWVLAATSTETLTLTQQNGSSNTFYGENANSRLEGTFIENVDVTNSDGTFLLAGFSYTHFTTGTTPRTENVVIENMTFVNEAAREWKLGNNPISYVTQIPGGTNGYIKITLPEDHGLPVGYTDVLRTDAINIVGNTLSTWQPRWFTDINGLLYITVHPDDPKNVIRTNMNMAATPQYLHGFKGRLGNDGAYHVPETIDASATGGSLGYCTLGQYSRGVHMRFASGVVFRNCTFKGFGTGVMLRHCEDVLFEDCTFTGSGRGRDSSTTAIHIDGGCRNIRVRNCHISNYIYGVNAPYEQTGIYKYGSGDILMEGCTIDEVRYGIITNGSIGITIRNNDINIQGNSPTLHQFRDSPSAIGIYTIGTRLLIEGNNIYGRRVPPIEGTYSAIGFGVHTNGENDYPLGDVTQSASASLQLPCVSYGLYILDRFGGFTGEITGVSKKIQGPIVRNNTIKDTWYAWGIYMHLDGGHTTAPKKYSGVVVSNNKIVAGKTAIGLIARSTGSVDGIYSLEVNNNTTLYEPRIFYISSYLRREASDGTSLVAAESSTNHIYIAHDGGDSPPVYEEVTICNNNIHARSTTHNVYPIRLGGGVDKAYVFKNMLISGNKITGGTYCMYLDNPDLSTAESICKETAIMGNFFCKVKHGTLHNADKFASQTTNRFLQNYITQNDNTHG